MLSRKNEIIIACLVGAGWIGFAVVVYSFVSWVDQEPLELKTMQAFDKDGKQLWPPLKTQPDKSKILKGDGKKSVTSTDVNDVYTVTGRIKNSTTAHGTLTIVKAPYIDDRQITLYPCVVALTLSNEKLYYKIFYVQIADIDDISKNYKKVCSGIDELTFTKITIIITKAEKVIWKVENPKFK